MPKKVYTDEFRERMIELVGSGRQVESLVRELKVSGQTIRTWVKQHQLDSGSRKDGMRRPLVLSPW